MVCCFRENYCIFRDKYILISYKLELFHEEIETESIQILSFKILFLYQNRKGFVVDLS